MTATGTPATEWRYAAATVDLTPQGPVTMAGVAGRARWGRKVAHALEANAVTLRWGRDCVLFISVDLLFAGERLTRAVEEEAARHGLPRTSVVIVASHTHFAPATDDTKPLLGAVDPVVLAEIEARLRALVSRSLTVAPVAASVIATRASTELNVNRRRRWPFPTWTRAGLRFTPSVAMAPEPSGRRDGSIDVLRVEDAAGTVLGVLWKFACHPVGYPVAETMTSEFPGVVRDRLRAAVGRDVPVVFLQGFSGDVRPRIPGRVSWTERLATLYRGPGCGRIDLRAWQEWSNAVAHSVLAAAQLEGSQLVGPLTIAASAVPTEAILDCSADPSWAERGMELRRVAFGSEREILCVGAEVCSPYLELLGTGASTLCVGCLAHVFGYLPSETQREEGGYEGAGFLRVFSIRGRLASGMERAVVDAVDRLRRGDVSP